MICNCEKLILKKIADILLSEKYKVDNRVYSMISVCIKFYLKSIIYYIGLLCTHIQIHTHTYAYTHTLWKELQVT